MAISSDIHFIVAASILWTEASDEIILLDPDNERFYGLEETGAVIWRGMISGKTLARIIDEIADAYQVDAGVVEADVLAFVLEMTEQGWIQSASVDLSLP